MSDLCYNCALPHLPQVCSKTLAQCEICFQMGHFWWFCHLGPHRKQPGYQYNMLCHNCDSWHLPQPCQKEAHLCEGCGQQGHLRYFCPFDATAHPFFPERFRASISKFNQNDIQLTLHDPVFARAVLDIKMTAVDDALRLAQKNYRIDQIRGHLFSVYGGRVAPQQHYPVVDAQHPSEEQQNHTAEHAVQNSHQHGARIERSDDHSTNPELILAQLRELNARPNGVTGQHQAQNMPFQGTNLRQPVGNTQYQDQRASYREYYTQPQANSQSVYPANLASNVGNTTPTPSNRVRVASAQTLQNFDSHVMQPSTPVHSQGYEGSSAQPMNNGPYYGNVFQDGLRPHSNNSVNEISCGHHSANDPADRFVFDSPGATPSNSANLSSRKGDEELFENDNQSVGYETDYNTQG